MADRFTKQLTRSLNDQNRVEVMTGNLSALRTGELLSLRARPTADREKFVHQRRYKIVRSPESETILAVKPRVIVKAAKRIAEGNGPAALGKAHRRAPLP